VSSGVGQLRKTHREPRSPREHGYGPREVRNAVRATPATACSGVGQLRNPHREPRSPREHGYGPREVSNAVRATPATACSGVGQLRNPHREPRSPREHGYGPREVRNRKRAQGRQGLLRSWPTPVPSLQAQGPRRKARPKLAEGRVWIHRPRGAWGPSVTCENAPRSAITPRPQAFSLEGISGGCHRPHPQREPSRAAPAPSRTF